VEEVGAAMVAVGIEDGDWDSSKMAERRNKKSRVYGSFPHPAIFAFERYKCLHCGTEGVFIYNSGRVNVACDSSLSG
jgi:hypothetical protein